MLVIGTVTSQVEKLLRPYVLHEGTPSPEANVLLVVKERKGEQFGALASTLAKRLRGFPPKQILVATLSEEPDQEIQDYYLREGQPGIHFPGPLELRFFLQVTHSSPADARELDEIPAYGRGLERFRDAMEAGDPTLAQRGEFQILELRLRENLNKARMYGATKSRDSDRYEIADALNGLARSLELPLFTELVKPEETGASRPSPVLLLTHAFDPETEPELCLLAARTTARILEAVPRGAEIRVHLAVAHPRLRDMITTMQPLTAWVFLGPAGGPKGLLDVASGGFVAPDAWVACFRECRRQPALALFLGGGSEETARRFAQSSSVCAIGLNSEGLSEALLSSLPGLFRRVFTDGVDCRWIETHLSGVSGHRVFCSGHP